MSFSELAERNMTKLKKRFPSGEFSKDRQINKDKDAEQQEVDDKEYHPNCPNNDIEEIR